MSPEPARPVVYLITCATLAAADIGKLVTLAQDAGWQPCVIVTPKALNFIDRQALEAQTGYPVRADYKHPSEADALPKAEAIICAGASFNTINKWALGISDTLALGILNEAIGLGLPIVLLPFVNRALAAHPAWDTSIARLRAVGVTVLLGPEVYEPHGAGEGKQVLAYYPWGTALRALSVAGPSDIGLKLGSVSGTLERGRDRRSAT
jgi:phosphopantothenoylcysteine synthetase/decarboxylase